MKPAQTTPLPDDELKKLSGDAENDSYNDAFNFTLYNGSHYQINSLVVTVTIIRKSGYTAPEEPPFDRDYQMSITSYAQPQRSTRFTIQPTFALGFYDKWSCRIKEARGVAPMSFAEGLQSVPSKKSQESFTPEEILRK